MESDNTPHCGICKVGLDNGSTDYCDVCNIQRNNAIRYVTEEELLLDEECSFVGSVHTLHSKSVRSDDSNRGSDLDDFVVYDRIQDLPIDGRSVLVTSPLLNTLKKMEVEHFVPIKKEPVIIDLSDDADEMIEFVQIKKSKKRKLSKSIVPCRAQIKDKKKLIKKDEIVRQYHREKYDSQICFFGRNQEGFPGWNFRHLNEWHRCNPPDNFVIDQIMIAKEKEIDEWNLKEQEACRCEECKIKLDIIK